MRTNITMVKKDLSPPYAFVRVSGEMLTMLKKNVNYYDRHTFSPNDQEPAQVRIETESWMSDVDTLAPYLYMLSDREQRWVIEHAVHDQPPRMIRNCLRKKCSYCCLDIMT
ncbi:hypothetical protein [Salicibibacter kimchii]|uniref:hypothetical protein n=1 Tax=Salicibibacter kimchii TaxID=2099786 RepID=UPI001D055561|nr:hypothetical protein [Salicibibacter kimchii]